LPLVHGHMASSIEVKARWAYSELTSSRVSWLYRQHDLDGLDDMAAAGVDFERMSKKHRQRLVDLLHAVRPGLPALVDTHHGYVLDSWSKGRLCQAFAIAHFNTPLRETYLPFFDFLNRARDTGAGGTQETSDPRVAADKVTDSTMPEWGAIAVFDFPNLLVDGYLRAVLFMRDAPNSATLPVWVGLGATGWRAQAHPMAGAAATQ